MLHEWLIKSLCSSETSYPGSHCTCLSILASSWLQNGLLSSVYGVLVSCLPPPGLLHSFHKPISQHLRPTWLRISGEQQQLYFSPRHFVFYRSYFSCHYHPIFEEEGFILAHWLRRVKSTSAQKTKWQLNPGGRNCWYLFTAAWIRRQKQGETPSRL